MRHRHEHTHTYAQCLKLMVHSVPATHNSAARRTIFGNVPPMSASLFSLFLYKYIEGCMFSLYMYFELGFLKVMSIAKFTPDNCAVIKLH